MKDYNKKSAEEDSNIISNMINSCDFSNHEYCHDVCEAMIRHHRTIQQNFTRLAVEWIKMCASDEYRTDGRNEASHKICSDLCNGLLELTGQSIDDIGVPFI
jgi:hypothetical protein